MSTSPSAPPRGRRVSAGLVLGLGMGGFIDGIALHQIAHWHNMGSALLPPHTVEAMRQNMRWDGLFHLGTWLITLAGVWLLWLDARHGTAPPARVFIGQMLLGWAAFTWWKGSSTITCWSCTTSATCPPTCRCTTGRSCCWAA